MSTAEFINPDNIPKLRFLVEQRRSGWHISWANLSDHLYEVDKQYRTFKIQPTKSSIAAAFRMAREETESDLKQVKALCLKMFTQSCVTWWRDSQYELQYKLPPVLLRLAGIDPQTVPECRVPSGIKKVILKLVELDEFRLYKSTQDTLASATTEGTEREAGEASWSRVEVCVVRF
jgi:hypothetical protein